jgi:Fe2+ or Zn2+ uptake regulation protein
LTATKHLDASQILRKARTVDASVDRSTVYRTLDLLKRQGLIDELDLMHLKGEGHYYERKLGRDHYSHGMFKVRKDRRICQQNFRVPEETVRA